MALGLLMRIVRKAVKAAKMRVVTTSRYIMLVVVLLTACCSRSCCSICWLVACWLSYSCL